MKALLFACSFLFIFQQAFTQNTPVEKLSSAFEKSAADFPKSKTFIKTDKDIYAPGEKLWFKAEILNCLTEKASNEKSLVVMIKAESGEVIADGKYLILNGIVNNELTIPSWAPEGGAFVIAYIPGALTVNEASLSAIKPITINLLKKNDYILSAGVGTKIYKPSEDVKLSLKLNAITPSGRKERVNVSLFDYQQEISSEKVAVPVGQTFELKYKLPEKVNDGLYFVVSTPDKNNLSVRIPVHTSADNIKVAFFTEGGNLLSNNTQRIVYRAIDPFGKPASVSGSVYDELNNRVGTGKILKNGIGLISLMPSPEQVYTFKIESEYGKGQKFDLPQAVKSGSVFTLTKTEDSLLRIAVNSIGSMIGKKLTMAAIAGGKVRLSSNFEAKQKNDFKIFTSDLPAGIVDFVLLDQQKNLLSERLVYNVPNGDINIAVQTTLKTTFPNEEVDVTIDMTNFIKQFGNCLADVKIVDTQNLYNNKEAEPYNFLKYPLSTAIPKTVLDIYLTNIELIANKYSYFSIQDIMNGVDYAKKDQNKIISGYVTDKNGNKIPDATVMIVHPNNLNIATTTTDKEGYFEFGSLVKSKDMLVKAVGKSGRKNYQVHLNRSFNETLEELLLLKSFHTSQCYNIETTPRYFEINKDLLAQTGSENKTKKPKQSSNVEKLLQSGSSLLEVIKMIKPFSIWNDDQIVFYGSANSFNNQEGALIVIDGQKMGTSTDALNYVNPYDVVSINISTDPVDIQKYTAFNSIGIIEIWTRESSGSQSQNDREKSQGKIFQKFEQSNFPKEVWKYQSTLFWQPNMQPDENGIIRLKLKTSELKSNFVVQVDATSADGIKCQQSTTFSTIHQ